MWRRARRVHSAEDTPGFVACRQIHTGIPARRQLPVSCEPESMPGAFLDPHGVLSHVDQLPGLPSTSIYPIISATPHNSSQSLHLSSWQLLTSFHTQRPAVRGLKADSPKYRCHEQLEDSASVIFLLRRSSMFNASWLEPRMRKADGLHDNLLQFIIFGSVWGGLHVLRSCGYLCRRRLTQPARSFSRVQYIE